MKKISFGILGGDYRHKLLKDLIAADGYGAYIYGSTFADDNEETLSDMVKKCNAVVGAVPCTTGCGYISMGYGKAAPDELFGIMEKNGVNVFIGGIIKPDLLQCAQKHGINTYDIFDVEEVSVRNAVPTAEGAVMTAMQESEITIFKSRCLVIGWGRCGKMLARDLKGLGAYVSIACRKNDERAYIESEGMDYVNISDIDSCIDKFDFIFNTVPALVLYGDILRSVSKNAVIIDIAQAPGGVDYSLSAALNIKALYCPGLPGRCAPLTAAEIIKKAVLDIAVRCLP